MAKEINIQPVSFDPAAKTLDFSAWASFDIRKLIAVINDSRNVLIYSKANEGFGLVSFSNNILALQFDTTLQNSNDKLSIFYDDLQHVIIDSLPSGLATSINQDDTNAKLESIDLKIPNLISGKIPVDTSLSQPLTNNELRSSAIAVNGTFWQATQPVSVVSLPLPTDAATALNQVTGNNNLANIDLKFPSQGQALASASLPVVLPGSQITSLTPPSSVGRTWNLSSATDTTKIEGGNTNAVKIDGSATTQPISAITLPLPNGAATSAKQDISNTSLSSIDLKLPTLSAGKIPVDTFLSQPLTDTQLRAEPLEALVTNFPANQLINAESLPLPNGASTSSLQSAGNTSLSSIDNKIPVLVSGKIPVETNLTPLTDTQLRASAVSVAVDNFPSSQTVSVSNFPSTQAVSISSLPLPTGAATSALQTTGNTSLSNLDVNLGAKADLSATTDNGTFSLISLVKRGLANWTSLLTKIPNLGSATKASSIPVNIASDQTVPVSGTFWQSTQPISASNLPLPNGAATSARQPAVGIAGIAPNEVLTIQGIAGMNALKVDGSSITQPISVATLPLPTNAATASNQVTGNNSLANIDNKLPTLILTFFPSKNVGIILYIIVYCPEVVNFC
jgi:hypothetical protein